MRRLLSHLLLAVGVVLSLATSTQRISDRPGDDPDAPPPNTAEVESAPVTLAEEVTLDRYTPLLLQVTVHVDGSFSQDGEDLGPGDAALVVELDGAWSWLGGAGVWKVDDAAEACVRAGMALATGTVSGGVARVEAPVERDVPLLLAVQVAEVEATFAGALHVAAMASVTGNDEALIDVRGVTPSVEAALVPVDCGGGDTGDTGPADTGPADTGPADTGAR